VHGEGRGLSPGLGGGSWGCREVWGAEETWGADWSAGAELTPRSLQVWGRRLPRGVTRSHREVMGTGQAFRVTLSPTGLAQSAHCARGPVSTAPSPWPVSRPKALGITSLSLVALVTMHCAGDTPPL
jgi:hypothetical protein